MHDTSQPLGVPTLLRFSALALEALAEAREEIDALNVYPVPDGDTGTNLFLTFESAHAALEELLRRDGGDGPATLGPALLAYCRGLLLGARGNSGVIMAQLLGALLRRVAAAEPHERPAAVVAAGMVAATEAGYAAVGDPVEGTMLTVSRTASDAATRAVENPEATVGEVLEAALEAARDALARTPEQLDVLRRAGVVDAGGQGLCVMLEAACCAFTGRRPDGGLRQVHRPMSAPVPLPEADLSEDGPAYEVMYLLDAPDRAVPELRRALAPLGDSLVVVGGDGLWNVHVHVDDVGAAVEAGIAAGRPHRIRVTHFAEQVARVRNRVAAEAARRAGARHGRAVVVHAFGAGLAKLFTEAGAVALEAGVDHRPSAGELLELVRATRAGEVVLLPNDRDVVPVAEVAAGLAQREDGISVAVIPTVAQVQGIAAMAVHDPARPFEQDIVEMAAAARHARSGAVTVAARRAITAAGECRPGDVLGAVEGDFVVIGHDLFEVAVEVIARLLGGGGELVTVIRGAGGDELSRRCVEHLAESYPLIDVAVHEGGQERYPVLFGVE